MARLQTFDANPLPPGPAQPSRTRHPAHGPSSSLHPDSIRDVQNDTSASESLNTPELKALKAAIKHLKEVREAQHLNGGGDSPLSLVIHKDLEYSGSHKELRDSGAEGHLTALTERLRFASLIAKAADETNNTAQDVELAHTAPGSQLNIAKAIRKAASQTADCLNSATSDVARAASVVARAASDAAKAASKAARTASFLTHTPPYAAPEATATRTGRSQQRTPATVHRSEESGPASDIPLGKAPDPSRSEDWKTRSSESLSPPAPKRAKVASASTDPVSRSKPVAEPGAPVTSLEEIDSLITSASFLAADAQEAAAAAEAHATKAAIAATTARRAHSAQWRTKNIESRATSARQEANKAQALYQRMSTIAQNILDNKDTTARATALDDIPMMLPAIMNASDAAVKYSLEATAFNL